MPKNDNRNTHPYPKPGRPKGSKTTTETVGKKRARRFFELNIDNGLRPTQSAEIVANEYGTGAADVFKAKKRHEPSLVTELQVETLKLENENNERRVINEVGPHELRGKAWVYHLLREALKGNL